jgi:hypothetical protein
MPTQSLDTSARRHPARPAMSASNREPRSSHRSPGSHAASDSLRGRHVAVATVRWPDESERLEALRARGEPRLLLVRPDATAPSITSELEDWVRLPGDPDDVDVRRGTLAARAAAQFGEAPRVDSDGLLHFRGQWAALSPTDGILVDALVKRFGAVVATSALIGAIAPEPGRGTLRVQITRLRARLEPLGLEVQAVRSRGYLLRVASTGFTALVPVEESREQASLVGV